MRRIIITALAICVLGSSAHAGLKIVGAGSNMRLDPADFSPAMKANYEIMRVRCVKCHTLERTVVALQTGVAPISGQPFDKSATRAYGIKMLRKPDSNMNKQEVKAVVDLMNYLLANAGK
ncbi:MAG: cytochrome C [Geobacteraceae bacterium]